ncbi:MAG: SMP-30/gluconolactonase/LRE family protein [Phycisphaerae bacterium]|nr:SMP-30/gluconolactonase/LRE family protein [Phycisphaerae bacterium]
MSFLKSKFYWLKWLFPVTGLAALIWFLIRVIPKPTRATYPCQRVAFPLASGFIIWLLGLAGSAAAFHKAKRNFARARYVLAAVCIVASIGFIWAAMNNTEQKIIYAHEPRVANSPLGEGKGVHPGRVAWIHDANATSWTGSNGDTSPPYWHSDTCTNQQVVDEMLSKAIRSITGKSTDYAAWDAIFRSFNQGMGKGDVGYTPGEKIAIKANFTLMNSNPSTGIKPTDCLDQIDNSPQLAIALLKQLTDVAGVAAGDISIGDPGRMMSNQWYDIVGPNCPGVVYLKNPGYSLYGRTNVTYDTSAPFYWSDPVTSRVTGKTQDYIPTHFAQAEYFINFPILKSHDTGGITVCGKNNYGSLIRNPNASGYYNTHDTRPAETPGMGHYRAIVDFMSHPRLGGKTLLALIDGLYSGQSWDSTPIRWEMAPFNNDWPSSIFVSMDQVAADSVADDFMYAEWDGVHTGGGEYAYPHMSGADDYLHEAALIPSPPSGANYDPNHDGGLTESLGVHEHWNNSTDKQYSRNLSSTGDGIELTTDAPSWADLDGDWDVDLRDFAIFAKAWCSTSGGPNWDPNCNIAISNDNIIDERDLVVLCDNYLDELTDELIVPGATIEEVYSVSGVYFEGATWDPKSSKLFFTKRTGGYQILRLDSPGSAYVWLNSAPATNGMLLSLDGRLLTADEDVYQIRSHRIGASGPEDTVVLGTASKKPNDLCQLANGNIYFTCPDWGVGPNDQGVYLLETDGTVTLVKNGLYQPNGIITSLDETKLYVAESSSGPGGSVSTKRWWVFPINSDGTLGTGSVFFKPTSPPRTNDPDGMTIDERGNLYFCGLGGVWIVSPAGVELEMINVPTYNCSNACFGGPENKTLYITCQDKVYTLDMVVRGGE